MRDSGNLRYGLASARLEAMQWEATQMLLEHVAAQQAPGQRKKPKVDHLPRHRSLNWCRRKGLAR